MVGVSIRDIEKLKKLVYSDFVSGKKRQLVDFVKGKARQAAEITNKKRLQEIMMEGWKPKSHKKAVKYVDKKRAEGKKSKSSFKPSPKRPPRAENPEETKQLFGIAKKRKEEFKKGGVIKKIGEKLYPWTPTSKAKWKKAKTSVKGWTSDPKNRKKLLKAAKNINKAGKFIRLTPLSYVAWAAGEKAATKGYEAYKKYKKHKSGVKHLGLKEGGLVKPKSARIATRGWGKVIK